MIDVELKKRGVYLGKTGETGRYRVWLDVSAWDEEYEGGVGLLLYTDPKGNTAPMRTVKEFDGEKTKLYGYVTAEETKEAGTGVIEVRWENAGVVAKSDHFNTVVMASSYTGKNIGDNTPDWVRDLMTELNAVNVVLDEAAQVAEDVAAIRETIEGAETVAKAAALDAEAWAVGERDGEDVDEDDPTYGNNARKYAQDAGGSAAAAGVYKLEAEAWAKGTKNGQAVPSTDPAYQKNAKYYAEQAFSGTPEGYADLVGDVGDLKSAIEQAGGLREFNPTGAGSTKYDYAFKAGETYLFVNNCAVSCTLTTNNGTSMVERIGTLLPGAKASFVPTQDAPKINCYLSARDDTGSIYAYNGDYAKNKITIDGINEAISGINDSLDGLEEEDDAIGERIGSIENMESQTVYSTTVSGTQSVQKSVSIPAGKYTVKCTDVTSADTDSDKCGVYFSVGTTQKALLYVDRNTAEYSLTLEEAITHIIFWASNTYAKGAGDAFSFGGFSIEKSTPIVETVTGMAARVDEIGRATDELAKQVMSGTYTGTTQYWTAKEFPEGDYYIRIGNIETDDTDADISAVMFTTSGNSEKLTLRFIRGREQARHFHLPSGVGRVFFFPSRNYASSVNDSFTFSNVVIWKVNEGLLDNREIPTPEGFTWTNHPLAGHLFRTEQGIACDFDVADLKPSAGKTYWVAPDGDDAAAGTDSEHPLQSLRTALLRNDVDTIIVKDGFYESSLGPGHVQGLSRSVAIVADEGANPVISSNTGAHTWAKTSGYTYLYETAATDTNTVWDIANEIPYTRVTTLAEAEAAGATYYCDGTKTYVHTKSGDAPTTAIRCCAQRDNFRITTSGRITLYVEGLTICGGDDGAFQIVGDGSTRPLVYGKKCLFTGGFLYGACYLGGCESIMQDCEACESTSDGFGIHMNLATGTVPPLAVEINCEGHHNGIAGDLNNDNGTTIHAGGKVIRVNGRYHHNKGPNVADVHANTQSWNLGCRAWASTSRASNTYNFEVSTRGPEMWLDTCAGFDSTCSLYVGTGSTTYLHNCALVNMQVNEDAYIEAY